MGRFSYYSPEAIGQLLKKERNVYFIGIGGVSMSSLAEISHNAGYKVAGSDRTPSAITSALENAGITVYKGHDAKNCEGYTVFVYNAAIHEDNPEYAYAKENGYPLIRRADYLGYAATFYKTSIGVAGTHGKSTSTAMLGEALTEAGLDPAVLNGAVMPKYGSPYKKGGKNCICFEACEYTDSFLSFYPTVAVVLNAEFDHADYFKTRERYIESFKKYINQSPCAVVNIDSDGAEKAAEGYTGRLITCAVKKPADVTAENLTFKDSFAGFDVTYKGSFYAHVSLSVGGMHNVYNALCCAAACIMIGADPEKCAYGISSFSGVARRFEYKFTYNGADVYDDYAHHPDEIKATLSVARQRVKGRLYVAFQPHTYTRTRDFYGDFLDSFKDCDEVIFCDIYAARETDTLGMSAQKLASDVPNGTYKGGFDEVAAYLKSVLEKDDGAVIMGAGDVVKIFAKF
ncbi:MAG: UDP-N-acetylmuramate--L-alanine ligase [Clostridia bacterium]|nr:UDP-N-acetylmuramate--L-alanine ligase [Clostridia bacterium]